jgi:glycogen debranching enzyme
MITALGARFVPDETIQSALRVSISRLKQGRSPTGAIPNFIDDTTGRSNFRAYADGGLWWIVGSVLLSPDAEGVRGVLRWCEYQDVDQSGLLSMQEASDWQDLFCTRGKGLYLNCLYVLALRAAGRLFAESDRDESARSLERAEQVTERINALFWYRGDGDLVRHISHTFSTQANLEKDSLGRRRWIPSKRCLIEEQYYLPYLGFRTAGEWFDSLGNLLAILAGVAGQDQTGSILDLIARHSLDKPPLRALTPVIRPGDADWRDYYGVTNPPYHHHNGGVWPFIGGFYVAALVKAGRHQAALRALGTLADLNLRGGFNEWHHGETGEPLGAQDQAWSAGMYLFARACVGDRGVELP